MRALSIRQPYAELILRGTCGEHTCGEHTCGEQTCGQQIKPIEFRSRQALIIGERLLASLHSFEMKSSIVRPMSLMMARSVPGLRSLLPCIGMTSRRPSDAR